MVAAGLTALFWEAEFNPAADEAAVMARAFRAMVEAAIREVEVVVPREPTEAMREAAEKHFDWGPSGYDNAPGGAASPEKVWRRMVEAALHEIVERRQQMEKALTLGATR